MDNTILHYIIKVNVVLCLTYILYYLFLRKDTFFVQKRFYFLIGIVFSFIYPLIRLNVFDKLFTDEKMLTALNEVNLQTLYVTNNVIVPVLNLRNILVIIIASISILLLIRLLFQCFSVIRLKAVSNNIISDADTKIIHVNDKNINPFSFFGWIFINKNLHSEYELKEILEHEKIHVRQNHSVDIITIELVCALFWWNPVLWMLRRDMKENLEYIADDRVLLNGTDSKGYQYLLLKQTNRKTAAVVNNFNVSQLKNRIIMMNKEKTKKRKLMKYLLIIPVLFTLFMFNTTYAVEAPKVAKTQDKESTSSDQVYEMVEKMPLYPGGINELFKYLAENIKYPEDAVKNKTQGKVVVSFIVSKTGEIKDIHIVRSLSSSCDAEAVRVVQAMPKWEPGEQNGEKVNTKYTLPINFSLN